MGKQRALEKSYPNLSKGQSKKLTNKLYTGSKNKSIQAKEELVKHGYDPQKLEVTRKKGSNSKDHSQYKALLIRKSLERKVTKETRNLTPITTNSIPYSSTPASGVDEDSWTRYIPVYGSSVDAYDAFSEERYFMGTIHTLLAVSDVFLVKSLFTGIGKAVIRKGLFQGTKKYFGVNMSQKAGASISRLRNLGVFPPSGGAVHHWAIPDWYIRQNSWIAPFANQAWNFKYFKDMPTHMRWAHGLAFPSQNLAKIPYWKYVYPFSSTPDWFRFGVLPKSLKLIPDDNEKNTSTNKKHTKLPPKQSKPMKQYKPHKPKGKQTDCPKF